MNAKLTVTSAAAVLVLWTGCQPVVTSPITAGPQAEGDSTGGSTGAGGGGTGGATSACGSGVPANPAVLLADIGSDWQPALAVDATSLYWTGTQIWKISKDGSTRTALSGATAVQPGAIVVDAANVYWAGEYGVYQVPVGGGTPIQIEASPSGGLAVDATTIYWSILGTDLVSGNVMKAPIGGGAATLLGACVGTLAVDATNVYCTHQIGPIAKLPLAGGPPVTLATVAGSKVWGLVLGAGNVYWAANQGPAWVPTAGGPATYGTERITGIAVDDANVYWSDYDNGAICKTPIGGGAVTTLATGQTDAWTLVVDDTSVYWDNGNSIMKTAK